MKVNEILKLEDLVRDDNLVFVATGITHGELLKGISRRGNLATTETLLIRGKSRTIRKSNPSIISIEKILKSMRF